MNQTMSDLRNQVQAAFLQDDSLHECGGGEQRNQRNRCRLMSIAQE